MANLPSCEDYEIAINVPRLIKSTKLLNGHVEKNIRGVTIRYVGGFCIVFPYYKANGQKTAVRCWIANVEDSKERIKRIAEYLQQINLPYFVDLEYEHNGIVANSAVHPIVLMDWVNASILKEYIKRHLNEPETLRQLAESFKQMVQILHKENISHGDLQHGNIMVKNDGSLVLVDYDSMYIPALDGYNDEIKGLIGYQHPARWSNKKVSPKADYFSELIIYTSIMALSYFPDLWGSLKLEDTETLLFTADDIESKGDSSIFKKLSSHSELKQLSDAIIDALEKKSIEELLPLEDAIIPKLGKVTVQISKGWGEKPKIKTEPNNLEDLAIKISEHWQEKAKPNKDMTSVIASQWNKNN